jgi:nucleotide-binding universal stress UspA family protein
MKRFKDILYYTDASEGGGSALERAAELALRNRGRLTVLGVLERLPRDLQMLVPVTPPADLQELAIQDLRQRLAKLVKPVRQKGLHLNIETLIGTPFLEIIRAVLAQQHDLVMLTTEGTGPKQPLLGSTSLHLMRKCPCPVWVIKPGPHRRFKRILAAVNPDPYDEEHRGVNATIMELATSLARLEGSELRIVHAWDVQGENVLRHWHKHLPAADVDRIVRDTEATHQLWLNELLAKHPLTGIPHNVHLLRGEPAAVITDLAAKRGIDLIVMGTVGRTGIPGFLIGNTAETVLRQVNCSVLAVKPEGFVTPVKLSSTEVRTP